MPLATEVIVALIGLLGCVATGFLSARAARKKAIADEKSAAASVQQSLNSAFTEIVKALREERIELRYEINGMKQEMVAMNNHIVRLEAELVSNGHIVPPRPVSRRSPRLKEEDGDVRRV